MAKVLQKTAEKYDPRGRLDPIGFQKHIRFHTYVPPEDLKPFLEHFWTISWDKTGTMPYISEEVMHRPYVDAFFSTAESGIQGTFRAKRAYKAAGEGRIIGARFLPGAFHAFYEGTIAELQDKMIAIDAVFPEITTIDIQHLLSQNDKQAVATITALLREKHAIYDGNIEILNKIIAAIESDDNLTTVTAIAKRFMKSERWLQQLFQEYVGLGLAWFLKRKRLLAAAKEIREHVDPDYVSIAYDLGYSSQQHFISDFKKVIGKTPLQYKKTLTKQ